MSTAPRPEIEAFYQFLGARIQEGLADFTPEDSVEAFRAYQRKLDEFRVEMQPALDQLNRDLDRLRKSLQPALHRVDQGAPASPSIGAASDSSDEGKGMTRITSCECSSA